MPRRLFVLRASSVVVHGGVGVALIEDDTAIEDSVFVSPSIFVVA